MFIQHVEDLHAHYLDHAILGRGWILIDQEDGT